MPRPIHFEIHSPDAAKAVAFYERVFDWKFNKWEGPMEYYLASTGTGPGIDGGLMPSRDGQPRVVNTVEVADVDEHVKKINAAGGQVVVPKMAIQGVGYVAYCTDPTGVLFGVMHNDPNAK